MKKLYIIILLAFVNIITNAQNYKWAKSIGSTSDDRGNSIAHDGAGNCYIGGYFQGTADFDPGPGTANMTSHGSNDIFFAKYDANGNYIWAKSIGSIDIDECLSIAVDSVGNCYITGCFSDIVDFDPGAGIANLTSVGGQDIFFAKYDANGNYIWAKNIGSTNSDWGIGIAIDGAGSCYITGHFSGTADFDPGPGIANHTPVGIVGIDDTFLAKYDSNGNYLWANSIGSIDWDWGTSIAIDGTGSCYIIGRFQGTADFDPGAGIANLTSVGGYDIFFTKYDSNGNYLWAKSIGSTGEEVGNIIAVNGTGNCYITGFFSGTADFDPGPATANLTLVGMQDIFFAKYDTNGNYIWAKNMGSSGNYNEGKSIAIDSTGDCYLTGIFGGTVDFDPGAGTVNLTSVGWYDIFFAKYDSNGNYLWAKNIGSPFDDRGWDIKVDGTGNCYLTGYFNGTADFDPGTGTANQTSIGNTDIFFAKYTQQPVIYVQPRDSAMCILNNQVISITASSIPVMSYQWQYNNSGTWNNVINGTPIGASYTGQTTNSMAVSGITSTGIYQYRCYVTNIYGADTSNTDTLTIIPPYHINLDSVNGGINDTLTLSSYPATLDAGNGFQYYAWSNGATTQTIQATGSGWYSVTVSSSFGCTDIDSIFLQPSCSAYFSLYPDTLVLHQYYAVNMATGTLPLSYLWSWGDGTFDNIAYPTHIYSTAGNYNICLTITDAMGCTNTYCDSSYLSKNVDAMVYVNVILPVSVNENFINDSFVIYPNPTTDNLTIETPQKATIEILNIEGQIIKTINSSGKETTIDLRNLSSGVYIIKAKTERGVVVKKFIKE